MQAETQSASSTNPSGNGAYSGSGTGSGSGGTVIGFPTEVTAEDKAKETSPLDTAAVPLTLSEQIAANFAALSSLMGDQQAGSFGGISSPVPISVPAKTSSPWIWVIMIGAAIAAWYFVFHKKGGEHGE